MSVHSLDDDGHVQIRQKRKKHLFLHLRFLVSCNSTKEKRCEAQHSSSLRVLHYTHSIVNFSTSFVLPVSVPVLSLSFSPSVRLLSACTHRHVRIGVITEHVD